MTLPRGTQPAPFASSLAISSLRATLLVVNSAPGLLVNNNATGGVWVGTSSGLANDGTGGGIFIGPLGSLKWGGGPLYGVLDNTTNPTANTCVLTYTNNASDPVNPVAVGVAVATQLLVTGVPLVYQTVQVLNISLTANTTQTIPGGVSQYASLLLRLANQVAGQKSTISLIWFADAACTIPNGIGDNLTIGNHPSALMVSAWDIPVRGLGLQIISRATSQGTVGVFVQGTNRTVPSIRQITTTQLPRIFGFTSQNLIAGVPVLLTNTDGLGDYTSLNGQCDWSTNIGPATTGEVLMGFTAFNSTESNEIVAASAGQSSGQFRHPNLPVRWQFVPSATVAGVSFTLLIVPATYSS